MPYSEAAKVEARAYLKKVRSKTRCRWCKRKPVDFHDLKNKKTPQRVGSLAACGYPITKIQEVIARCEPLCRRCHMKADGRHRSWLKANVGRKGQQLKPLRPCKNEKCGVLVKHMRKGFCNYCYKKWKYGGRKKPVSSVVKPTMELHSGVV